MTKRNDILAEAQDLITGDRAKTYGDAKLNHERIAAIWSVVLGHPVTPQQVALCMAGVKIARLAETPNHKDSHTDLIGYAALAWELCDEK
mgnify:CR=1 FL=1|jgi:hypothetical protein